MLAYEEAQRYEAELVDVVAQRDRMEAQRDRARATAVALEQELAGLAALERFFLTFGSQYSYEEHPRFAGAHPDGWVTIEAVDHNVARVTAFALFGRQWSGLYDEAEHDPSFYPRGELLRVMVPPAAMSS